MFTIILNYKNYLVGFLFFFKPKKINYKEDDITFFLVNIRSISKNINTNYVSRVYNF